MKFFCISIFLGSLSLQAMKPLSFHKNGKNMSQTTLNQPFFLSNHKSEFRQSALTSKQTYHAKRNIVPSTLSNKELEAGNAEIRSWNRTITLKKIENLTRNLFDVDESYCPVATKMVDTVYTREKEIAENYEKHSGKLEKTIEKLTVENDYLKETLKRNRKLMLAAAAFLIKREVVDASDGDKELLRKYEKYFCLDTL